LWPFFSEKKTSLIDRTRFARYCGGKGVISSGSKGAREGIQPGGLGLQVVGEVEIHRVVKKTSVWLYLVILVGIVISECEHDVHAGESAVKFRADEFQGFLHKSPERPFVAGKNFGVILPEFVSQQVAGKQDEIRSRAGLLHLDQCGCEKIVVRFLTNGAYMLVAGGGIDLMPAQVTGILDFARHGLVSSQERIEMDVRYGNDDTLSTRVESRAVILSDGQSANDDKQA
jgi:hypothetical protein